MHNEVMCCYAHEDQVFLNELRKHLSALKRQGLITLWSDIDISPGQNWQEEINKHLDSAKFILLLVSADFMHSDYCYSTEMERAIQRHKDGKAHVIPIILRPTFWEGTPLGQLQALPSGAKPVISWPHRDGAYHNITEHIKRMVEGPTGEQQVLPDSHPGPSGEQSLPPDSPLGTSGKQRRAIVTAIIGGLIVAGAGGIYIALHQGTSFVTTGSSTPTVAPRTGGGSENNGHILYRTASSGLYHVNYIMWSPKGPYLVTAEGDMTAHVIDATSGANVVTYRKHNGNVNAAVWSPDGKEIASASSDQTVQIWDALSGATRLTYQATTSVWIVAWSPDGTHIASAGKANTTQVWDVNTTQVVATYQGPASGILAVAWSSDSQKVATGYANGTVEIHSARNGSLLLTYQKQLDIIHNVMWSPHNDAIISASADSTVHIWDTTTGATRRIYTGHAQAVETAQWSPDGTLIASGDDGAVINVWNATTGETISTYHNHTDVVGSISWSPDGKHFASGSNDGTVRIWNA